MKKLAGIIFGAVLGLSMAFTSLAGTWIQDSNGWWYQNDDGSYPAGEWTVIDGVTYHFDSNGYMDVDGSNTSGSSSSTQETSETILKLGSYHSTMGINNMTGKVTFPDDTVSVTAADSNSVVVDGKTYSYGEYPLYLQYPVDNNINFGIYIGKETEFMEIAYISGNKTLSIIYTYVE